MAEWTEGMCGDGAVFIRDGEPQTISQVLEYMNSNDAILERVEEWWLREGMHKFDGAPECIFAVRHATSKDGST